MIFFLVFSLENRRTPNRRITKERPLHLTTAFDIRSSAFDILRFVRDMPKPAKLENHGDSHPRILLGGSSG